MLTTIKVNLIQVAASCLSKRLLVRSRLSPFCVRSVHMISLFALELHHRLCRRGRIIPMPNREPIIPMLNRGRIILMRSPEPMMRHSPNLVNPSQGANETSNCDKQEDILREGGVLEACSPFRSRISACGRRCTDHLGSP